MGQSPYEEECRSARENLIDINLVRVTMLLHTPSKWNKYVPIYILLIPCAKPLSNSTLIDFIYPTHPSVHQSWSTMCTIAKNTLYIMEIQ